jgi:hypothetical protein
MLGLASAVVMTASAGWSGVARAAEGVELPAPGALEWQPQVFPSISKHTRYRVITDAPGADGGAVPLFESDSECAASGMLLPVDGVDLTETPVLSWSWRVIRGLSIEDERSRSGDDFAARVYVLFHFDSESASVAATLSHHISSLASTRPIPGTTLAYVWASRIPVGESWRHPLYGSLQMHALHSSLAEGGLDGTSPSTWQSERVDVLADHRRSFGKQSTPRVMAIAIMTDSDNSCQSASAQFAGFAFSAHESSSDSAPKAHTGSGSAPVSRAD